MTLSIEGISEMQKRGLAMTIRAVSLISSSESARGVSYGFLPRGVWVLSPFSLTAEAETGSSPLWKSLCDALPQCQSWRKKRSVYRFDFIGDFEPALNHLISEDSWRTNPAYALL